MKCLLQFVQKGSIFSYKRKGRRKENFVFVLRTRGICSLSNVPPCMSCSGVSCPHRVVHSIPGTYLFYKGGCLAGAARLYSEEQPGSPWRHTSGCPVFPNSCFACSSPVFPRRSLCLLPVGASLHQPHWCFRYVPLSFQMPMKGILEAVGKELEAERDSEARKSSLKAQSPGC